MPTSTSLYTRARAAVSLRSRLREGWKGVRLRDTLRPHLTWRVKSGVAITVANRADWVIYNDVFVDGEYDRSIQEAISTASPSRPIRFLDLGSNVGFFALRVADLMRQRGGNARPYEITLVEGSPVNHAELRARISANPEFARHVRLLHGLVGQRSGTGRIYQDSFHGNTTLIATADGKEACVPFLDLGTILDGHLPIDLLKCDIEGSEQLFLENYADSLGGVQRVVIELHRELCDTDRCLQLLRGAGFTHHEELRSFGNFSVDLLWR